MQILLVGAERNTSSHPKHFSHFLLLEGPTYFPILQYMYIDLACVLASFRCFPLSVDSFPVLNSICRYYLLLLYFNFHKFWRTISLDIITSWPPREYSIFLWPAFFTRLLTPRSPKSGYGLLLGCRSGLDLALLEGSHMPRGRWKIPLDFFPKYYINPMAFPLLF